MPKIAASLLLLLSLGFSPAAEPGWDRANDILETYCFTCHDSETAKGDIVLDGILDSNGKITDYKLWESARLNISSGEMPPPKKKTQPTRDERTELAEWIAKALDRSIRENAGDPGMVTMRRLTNAEYRHTLRDLTGIAKNYARGFPSDGGGGEGFSNVGDVLFISPEQLEKYLASARDIANHASILPGTGIKFFETPIGTRGPDLLLSQTEQALRKWYRKHAAKFMPGDDDDLREADYLLACWKWKHRDLTKTSSLKALATEAKLNPVFLINWWSILSTPQPESRYLRLTTDAFNSLPPPDPARPRAEPAEVSRQAKAIQAQRRAWYTRVNDEWAHPQRLQQDADGIRSYTTKISLNGGRKVHLLVSALDDGNEGDVVYWSELRFQWADGNWDNLFGWMWRTGKAAKDEETKQFFHQYSRLEMKHPTGREMKKQTFAVHAPSIVSFPVTGRHHRLFSKSSIRAGCPGKREGFGSMECCCGGPPQKLPEIMPGVVTMWHRLTPTQQKLSNEFNIMKRRFPAGFDKRVFEIENNVWRWQNNIEGAYYLTNEQLYSVVADSERKFAETTRMDLGYVSNRNITKEVGENWDNHLVNYLSKFAARAWRRPVTDKEKEKFAMIYQAARTQEMEREDAAREVLVSILVSPHFLFKVEKGQKTKENKLTQYEYANRISYFLWSSAPDEALLGSAREGELSDWKVVCDHIDRMMASWKSHALAQEFGGQWLGFHDLHSLKTIDRKAFPEFTPQLRNLMFQENWRFIFDIIQNHRPLTDIVQARHTIINEPLANHYGIPGVKGEEYRFVDVSQHHRGGIFGMAGFHAKTSYPLRTSPVLRGNWILTEVLGRPTPPPPPNVPVLEEGEGETPLTLRAQLMKHREDSACATCHDRIDPLGFAMEKFDPIGRWRETDQYGRPIDDLGQTSDGEKLKGLPGLREWFAKEEEQFLHHFCTKLAGYGLGRESGVNDQLLIKEMVANMHKWNKTFGAAIKPLVLSRQFTSRRNF